MRNWKQQLARHKGLDNDDGGGGGGGWCEWLLACYDDDNINSRYKLINCPFSGDDPFWRLLRFRGEVEFQLIYWIIERVAMANGNVAIDKKGLFIYSWSPFNNRLWIGSKQLNQLCAFIKFHQRACLVLFLLLFLDHDWRTELWIILRLLIVKSAMSDTIELSVDLTLDVSCLRTVSRLNGLAYW